jgi:glucose/arabinose dehydrogenase
LLGIAPSPTFGQDNLVYAYFTAGAENRIVRFRLDSPQSQQVIVSGIPKGTIHNGGRIAFGPDGMLYAGVGEAGQTANAQNLQSLGGKILRMRPDGSAPPDNPFANSLVYSFGHRNVQGLAWDQQGRLFATEFGQNTWDEINAIVPGGNYGWPTVEGRAGDSRFRDPIVVWTTAEASPSGAAIANGTLFAAALRGTRLWLVPLNGTTAGTPTIELQGTFGRLRTVALGPDGWLWVTTSNRDGRGTPAASDDRIVRFPPLGTVTNGGPAIGAWTVSWAFPGNQQVTNFWNTQLTQTAQSVNAGNASWNGSVASNGIITFGFQASYSGSNTRPAEFRLNGTPCSLS